MVAKTFQSRADNATAESDDLYYVYYRWFRKKQAPRNPFIPLRLRKLTLEDFPPFLVKECQDPSHFIAGYLLNLIQMQGLKTGCCLLMPSISRLAAFFDVPHSLIEKSFWRLRKQGYDCMVSGHGEVTLSVQPLSPTDIRPVSQASF